MRIEGGGALCCADMKQETSKSIRLFCLIFLNNKEI